MDIGTSQSRFMDNLTYNLPAANKPQPGKVPGQRKANNRLLSVKDAALNYRW